MQTLQLLHDHAHILTALGDLDAGDLLQTQGIGQGVGMGTDAADALHQRDGLDEVFLHGQLLDAAVVIADEYLGGLDLLALGIEPCVDRLLQRGMIGPDGDDIAHFASSLPCILSISSFMGVTRIWP